MQHNRNCLLLKRESYVCWITVWQHVLPSLSITQSHFLNLAAMKLSKLTSINGNIALYYVLNILSVSALLGTWRDSLGTIRIQQEENVWTASITAEFFIFEKKGRYTQVFFWDEPYHSQNAKGMMHTFTLTKFHEDLI